MNMIVLFIRPELLKAVEAAVHNHRHKFMTVSEVLDSEETGGVRSYRGHHVLVRAKKLRLEIAVDTCDVVPLVAAIRNAVMADSFRGDGDNRLYILQLQECAAATPDVARARKDFCFATAASAPTSRPAAALR